MKWIKRLLAKCSTCFRSKGQLYKKLDEVYNTRGTAILFTMNNGEIDFLIYSENHDEVGQMVGCLASRADMDIILATMLNLYEVDQKKKQAFVKGFSATYKTEEKEQMMTPESAFVLMKGRSIR